MHLTVFPPEIAPPASPISRATDWPGHFLSNPGPVPLLLQLPQAVPVWPALLGKTTCLIVVATNSPAVALGGRIVSRFSSRFTTYGRFGVVDPVFLTSTPHPGQKADFGGSFVPHSPHVRPRLRSAPQLEQKRDSGRTTAEHCGQQYLSSRSCSHLAGRRCSL